MLFVIEGIKTQFFGCTSFQFEGLEEARCSLDRIYPLPFLDVLAATIAFVLFGIRVGNMAFTDREMDEQIARKSGLIANVVLDALAEDHLVQITTTRGKVYVGWVILGPGISREGKVEDVAVVPLYSGHRDPTTQKVTLDIDYSLALDEYDEIFQNESNVVDTQSPHRPEMSVVIPMGEIALIRLHNDEIERYFFPMNTTVN